MIYTIGFESSLQPLLWPKIILFYELTCLQVIWGQKFYYEYV